MPGDIQFQLCAEETRRYWMTADSPSGMAAIAVVPARDHSGHPYGWRDTSPPPCP